MRQVEDWKPVEQQILYNRYTSHWVWKFCFEVANFGHPEDEVRRISFRDKRFFALLRMTKKLKASFEQNSLV